MENTTETTTCRNCGETISRKYSDERYVSAAHGDVCLKADTDENGPDGAVSRNRIHAPVR